MGGKKRQRDRKGRRVTKGEGRENTRRPEQAASPSLSRLGFFFRLARCVFPEEEGRRGLGSARPRLDPSQGGWRPTP